MECCCCKEPFERKEGGFKRVGLASKFKGGPSAAESLDLTITPGMSVFICTGCSLTVRSLHLKKTLVSDVEKFRKVRHPGSYLATKLQMTPSHRSGSKRMRVMSSKIHTPVSPRTTTPKKIQSDKVCYT